MENQPSRKRGGQPKLRLGEILVDYGLINEQQLQQALKRQAQAGGQLGSILIEMGFISLEDLLEVLGKTMEVPSANLFNLEVPQGTINLLPMEKICAWNVLPVACNENMIALAMVNPNDFEVIREIEFTLGRKVKRMVVPHFMMEAAIKSLQAGAPKGLGLKGRELGKVIEAERERVKQAPDLDTLLRHLAKSTASDMLLTVGAPPSMRFINQLKRLPMKPLTPEDCEGYARALMTEGDWTSFMQSNEHDLAAMFPEIGRFRVNAYRQRGTVSIALRHIPDQIPAPANLNLPDWIQDFALKTMGLILVTGPVGHGKSTTLSAMVEMINNHRRCNIITLEEPVEYLHKHKKCNINQREVGKDTASFHQGLRRIFRQSPDVIVIGEMRDVESFEIALRAAETGMLVLTTVHAENTTSALERIINMFPSSQQSMIRMMLKDVLLLCLSQRLIPLKDGSGRVMALEKLVNSHRIKALIKEEKTHQIRTLMQAGTTDFASLDTSIAALVNEGTVLFEDGLFYALDEAYFRELTHRPGP